MAGPFRLATETQQLFESVSGTALDDGHRNPLEGKFSDAREAEDAKGKASAAEPDAEDISHSVLSPYEARTPSSSRASNDKYSDYRPRDFPELEDPFFGVDFGEREQSNQAGIDPDRVGNPASNLLEQSAPLFSSHTVLPPTARPNVPRKYTAEDWIVQKSEIIRLYNNNTLGRIRNFMREHHGLDATAKQYRDRITKWGLNKNIKATEMEAMIRKARKRALINKPSAFPQTDSMPNEHLNVPQVGGSYMPQTYSATPAVSGFQTPNMLGVDGAGYGFDSENFHQVPMSRAEGSASSYGHPQQHVAYHQTASSTSAYPLSPTAVPLSPSSPRIVHPSLAAAPSLVEVDAATRDRRRRSETTITPQTKFPRFPQTELSTVAQMEPAQQFFQAPTQGQDVDEEDVNYNEGNVEEDPDLEQLPLIPTYDGFKAHIRRLNPDMEPRYNWLVSRVAHQQEIRYKNLLDLRMKHTQATLNRTCQAGSHCLALGGSVTLLDNNGNPRDLDDSGAMQPVTDFPDNDSDAGEGVITEETFPIGIPMPPTHKLPAEFECQLCFKAKRFQKPADWTKHVREDVQPFTCTYDRCKEPKSFKRTADWVRHENERHRHLEWWVCQVDDCRHPCYRKENFLQHLVREHKFPEPKQKTKAAIKKARLTEPVWIMFEKCHHETTNRPQDEPCKFCGKQFSMWKRLTVHLAKHMEQISFPILKLVEARNVDANTIISPVEQIFGPCTPEGGNFQFPPVEFPKASVSTTTPVIKAPVQSLEQDWDLQPIASLNTFRDSALGSSLPSDISLSAAQGLPRTAQEEILSILNSDTQLQSLFQEAARRINKTRFVRNIRRLFLGFHRDLQQTAVDPREKDAASIVERHAQWLASRLFDVCDPDNGSNSEVLAAHLNQQVDKKQTLERYLASMVPQSQRSEKRKVQQDQDDRSGSSDGEGEMEGSEKGTNIDYSNFPNLEHIRKFIIGGIAFESLRRNTSQFVHPEDVPHALQTRPHTNDGARDQDPASKSPSVKQQASVSPSPEENVSEETGRASGSTAMTDITILDVDTDSDLDSADLSTDPDLDGAVQEDRILNPKAYFEKLEDLEREIFDNSGISAYNRGMSSCGADDDIFLQGPISPSVFHTHVDTRSVIPLIKFTRSGSLLQLLESHNLAVRARDNLSRLQRAGFCSTQVSLLVKDNDRPDVAKVVQVTTQAIFELGEAFERALRAVISQTSLMRLGELNDNTVNSCVEGEDWEMGLTTKCLDMLTSMGILPHLLLNEVQPIIWECATQCLDLGIMSYAGTHIQRFDKDLLRMDFESFDIPRRFTYHDETLSSLAPLSNRVSIKLRRRQFQCLDKFLGKKQPWVFHQDFSDEGTERLCLSTSIDDLTDLWGPSWKIVAESEPGHIQQFDIGNGSIVPWTPTTGSNGRVPKLHDSEVFCHWISSKDWDGKEVETNQSSLARRYFVPSDILLIGASEEYGLFVNPGCIPTIDRLANMKTKLDQQGALRTPKTCRPQRYIDSHAVQVQGTALGIISAAGIITYKRRNGNTMKDALVERRRHNLRNPVDLEAFSGVEISLCTGNARRRRLLHLLCSPSMQNYLRGISFRWVSEACEHAYFKALRCPKSFRKFWRAHPEYKENVGDAISKCLDALEETGIDEDSRELRGLWVEAFDAEGESDGESEDESDDEGQPAAPSLLIPATTHPVSSFFEEWIVTLFRSEHTWTGFLEDSEESLTMAIVGMTCLDFNYRGYGRRCSQAPSIASPKGYPVLQTALKLNESILKGGKLKQEKVENGSKTVWNARELKRGTSFPLGDHGALKVLDAASRTCL
ncbi:uncharacterized protein PAC_16676 [Phialocephala subalpina]|uniref:C2H2-type domain-containing protein n=1 Tax=Phialocephala subalpina TaxID=576137 RepID=A0A1L7XP03_9HELO|nr:uncharacterized protein PAC_16676 [Phialocephala subalpina]